MAVMAAKQLLSPSFHLKLQTRTSHHPSSPLLQSMGLYLRSAQSHTLHIYTHRSQTARRGSTGNSSSRSVGGCSRGSDRSGNKKGMIVSGNCSAEETKAQLRRSLARVKRRTRSPLGFDQSQWEVQYMDGVGVGREGDKKEERGANHGGHVPVMLGEVLEVFRQRQLHSFVDCTLGAAGHSTALIKAHPEMSVFIGMDMDSTALAIAQSQIDCCSSPSLRTYTHLSSFKHVRTVVSTVTDATGNSPLTTNGIDGILMDLGMSSMQVDNPERGFSVLAHGPLDMRMNAQASLRAADILNSWPEAEVGRILQEYGEESNWRLLLRKIMNARLNGGLHTTTELVDLIQSCSPKWGGRRGWIKTATRVFQALRIAVNDELKTLEDGLYACFDCLSSGGRLAVISFHSLEDRIVKHAFLKIVGKEDGVGQEYSMRQKHGSDCNEEAWRNGKIAGKNGYVLTKRPITPSEDEEKMNPRSRSAKLRVIQKL